MHKCLQVSISQVGSLILLISIPQALLGQHLDTPPPSVAGPAAQDAPSASPSSPEEERIQYIETQIETVDANTKLDDAAKNQLKTGYAAALQFLRKAQADAVLETSFRDAVASMPEQTAGLRKQVEALSIDTSPPGLPPDIDLEAPSSDIRTRLTQEIAVLAKLRDEVIEIERNLADLEKRPARIPEELLTARKTLAETKASLQRQPPIELSTELADPETLIVQAEAIAARREIARLEQEQLSYNVRRDLLLAQRGLAQGRLEKAQSAVRVIQEHADRALFREAEEASRAAAQAQAEAVGKHPAIERLAEEIALLASTFQRVVTDSRTVADDLAASQHALEQRKQTAERLRQQIVLGGTQGTFAKVLLEQGLQFSREARDRRRQLNTVERQLEHARLGAFETDQALRSQPPVQAQVAEFMTTKTDLVLSELPRRRIEERLGTLVREQRELLQQLGDAYRGLIDQYRLLAYTERVYIEETNQLRTFLFEKLFWVTAAPRLSLHTFSDLPPAIHWAFNGSNWRELGQALIHGVRRSPMACLLCTMVLVGLLALRRKLIGTLESTASRIRRISSDGFAHTVQALATTFLLALPMPVLMWFVGWVLRGYPSASNWLLGVGRGLHWAASATLFVVFLDACCRKNGLGPRHFRWHAETTAVIRRTTRALGAVYIPAGILIRLIQTQIEAQHNFSLGRLTFLAVMLWAAFWLGRAARPRDGVFSHAIRENPGSWVARLRLFWQPFFVAGPLSLALLSGTGFFLAAVQLESTCRETALVLLIGYVAYAFAVRWLSIHERKLKLEQRLQERQRAQEDAPETTNQQAASAGSGEAGLLYLGEEELDFDLVGEQTRRLLRVLIGALVAVGLYFVWNEVIPGLKALDTIVIVGEKTSLLNLLLAVVFAGLTVAAAKNLPGLLEIAFLRHLPMDAGGRYAVTTLCQYVIVTIGFVLVFGTLSLDWSTFGWIAAALSVGLGFGLQEIVANFVSGIILLFERPIRIGDVVTVSNIDGIVSRIHIRATTITNWDRKEFIVPNKEFITGTLLNWTLSNAINRIVIPVGVAYGSDTRKALELLLEAAHEHPRIMDDPAPLAAFEQFGDSSLNLVLRCFLPDMNNRIGTITELHAAIDRKFKEAGIEIAFPQMDVHVRNIDATAELPRLEPANRAQR